MSVQKKKKAKPSVKKSQKFNWTTQRKKAVQLLSTGMYSQRKLANELTIAEETISRWMQRPEFKEELDRLTYLQENATRAGIVRRALYALNLKERNIEEDKSTYLDYLEFLLKTIPPEIKSDDDKLKDLADAIMNSAKMIGK